jgi:hypothetical protein
MSSVAGVVDVGDEVDDNEGDNEGDTEADEEADEVVAIVPPAEPGTAVPHAPTSESNTPATMAAEAPLRAKDGLCAPITPPRTCTYVPPPTLGARTPAR